MIGKSITREIDASIFLPGLPGAGHPGAQPAQTHLSQFENRPEIVIEVGIWFLSSFFGNYFSGFLGTLWERMPHEAFFLMLTGLGISGGLAIWLLGRPLERVVEGHGRRAFQDGG